MSTLLVELTGEDRRRIDTLLGGCPTLELSAGSVYGRDDIPPAVLLVVDSGTVALARNGGESSARRVVVALATRGDVLLPPGRDAALTAVTAAEITAVTEPVYGDLLSSPDAAVAVAGLLAEAIAEREQSIATFGSFPHVERVRRKLLQLARSHGKVSSGEGILVDLPLTHDFLAEMVGSARETVTWALRELLEEGFVSRDGRRYRVHVAPEQLGGR